MNTIVKIVDQTRVEEPAINSASLAPHAFQASTLLKALGHEGRLMILYHLCNSEKTVSDLQELLHAPQALVSAHLARLRYEGMVTFRKEGKSNYYSLADKKARQVIKLVNTLFCGGLKGHH